MRLVIIAGAGCGIGFYRNVTKRLREVFTKVDVVIPIGEDFAEISKNIYNKLKSINEDFILMGHCLGGLTAIDIVTSKNKIDHLQKLILVNIYSDITFMDKQKIPEYGEGIDTYPEKSIQDVKDGLLDGSITSKQVNATLNVNLCDRLSKINIDTLLIGSEKDGYFSKENYLYMSNAIENSKLYMIKNARHLALLTNIDEVKEIIKQWMMVKVKYKESTTC